MPPLYSLSGNLFQNPKNRDLSKIFYVLALMAGLADFVFYKLYASSFWSLIFPTLIFGVFAGLSVYFRSPQKINLTIDTNALLFTDKQKNMMFTKNEIEKIVLATALAPNTLAPSKYSEIQNSLQIFLRDNRNFAFTCSKNTLLELFRDLQSFNYKIEGDLTQTNRIYTPLLT